jgi:hypothetical protein
MTIQRNPALRAERAQVEFRREQKSLRSEAPERQCSAPRGREQLTRVPPRAAGPSRSEAPMLRAR